ncbi:MAG: hypothetical protein ACXABY_05220 [Candidatus Thorarchaeota archaeon]|jgi:hypothetical protein
MKDNQKKGFSSSQQVNDIIGLQLTGGIERIPALLLNFISTQ